MLGGCCLYAGGWNVVDDSGVASTDIRGVNRVPSPIGSRVGTFGEYDGVKLKDNENE